MTFHKKLTNLLKQTCPRLDIVHRLEFKRCFGAVAGYIDNHIFVSCGKFGVALKLPPETLDSLFKEKGVKHLKYFPNGHVKKEYAILPKRILDDRNKLKKLMDESIKYILLNK